MVLLLWVRDDICLYAQLDALTCCLLPFWQVGAIGKFEGKGGVGLSGSDGVKGQHLLPFLPAFTAFVSRLQDLLVGLLYPGSPMHLLPLHPAALTSRLAWPFIAPLAACCHSRHGIALHTQGARSR